MINNRALPKKNGQELNTPIADVASNAPDGIRKVPQYFRNVPDGIRNTSSGIRKAPQHFRNVPDKIRNTPQHFRKAEKVPKKGILQAKKGTYPANAMPLARTRKNN